MSRKEHKCNRRKTVGSVEMLDERLLLNAGMPAPSTPAPAASPMSVAAVRRIELRLDRADHDLVAHSKKLDALVVRESARVEATLASLANRAQVQVQRVSNGSEAGTPASASTQNQAASIQLGKLVASFNTRLNQLNTSFQQQFGMLATPIVQAGARIGVPASALENNFQRARAGLTSVGSAASAVITAVTTTATKAATASTATTATTSTATATTTNGIASTQNFTNATTLAFSPLNAAINSVDAELNLISSSVQTAFQKDVTSLNSALNGTSGAFQPTVTFTSGNGVTFTST